MATTPGGQGGVWANSQNNPYPQSPLLDEQTKRPNQGMATIFSWNTKLYFS